MTEKLANILNSLDLGFKKTIENCNLLALWREVVDERVGRQSEAVNISNGTLHVKTLGSTWAQQLTYLKKEIIAKFNQKAGQEVIKDIRFKST